ncbi:MAG: winged helix-turn-helix domain-containing protein [Bryobacteraceae bacterium]
MNVERKDATAESIQGLDRMIHEPARLTICALLYPLEEADFLYLLTQSGLSKGNLSSHLAKLEEAQYVQIDKQFKGKIPQTLCRLTETGRRAFEGYRENLLALAKRLGWRGRSAGDGS